METQVNKDAGRNFSFKSAFTWCFVALFLPVWIIGFTSSIFASTCRKPGIAEERKVRACSISITTSYLTSLIASEDREIAILYLERGIAQSRLDRSEEALVDFRHAIEKATGVTLSKLAQRIKAREDLQEFYQNKTGSQISQSPISALGHSASTRFEELILRLIREEPTSKAWSNWEKLLKATES